MRAHRAVSSYGLRLVGSDGGTGEIPLDGEFVVGRSEGGVGNLQQDGELSRRHARFYYGDGGSILVVEDLQSTNGTFVNDRRISEPHVLRPGDRVRLGTTTLEVTSPDADEGRTVLSPGSPATPADWPDLQASQKPRASADPPASPNLAPSLDPLTPPSPARPPAPVGNVGQPLARQQVQMSERLRARMQKAAAPLMEPGETVVYGVVNLTLPVWAFAAFVGLLILPYSITKSSMAVVTDRNVYVIKTGLTGKGRKVLLKAPLGSMPASLGGTMCPGRYLMVGDQRLWLALNRKIRTHAEAIADAASTGVPPRA
jgi:hypothetical protein